MKALPGSALLAVASGSEALAAFAVSILVARAGGTEALGRLAAATAMLLIAVSATELGQNVVLTRRTASGSETACSGLGASLILKAGAGLLLSPAIFLLWPASEPPWGAGAALLYLILSSWIISATAVLRGRERFGSVTAASLSASAVAVSGMLALRPVSLSATLAVLAAAQALKAGVAFGSLPQGSRPHRPAAADIRGLLEETVPFAMVVMVSVAYLKADIVLLSAWAGAAEAGRYAGAVRLMEGFKILPAALGAALFPALAAGQERELPRALKVVGAMGAGVTILAFARGDHVLRALFGPPFASSAGPLSILSLAFLVGAVNALLILVLYARRQERVALASLAAALVANVLGNMILIPGRGAAGAAFASLASELVLATLYARALRRPQSAVGLALGMSIPRSRETYP